MCNIVGKTRVFGNRINEAILKGDMNKVKKLTKEFEESGYLVFFEKISLKTYEDTGEAMKRYNCFFNKSISGALQRGGAYQGTLQFFPAINKKNESIFSKIGNNV